MRMNSKLLGTVLLVLGLSGCATQQLCQYPDPPRELLIAPAGPGEFQDRMEAILDKGQTSTPTSEN